MAVLDLRRRDRKGVHMCDVTRSYVCAVTAGCRDRKRDRIVRHVCDVNRLCVWYDIFIFVE